MNKAKYNSQRYSAIKRNIEWHFTFETWTAWWQATGLWDQRGRGKEKYCMARIGDTGPYHPDNVKCITNLENSYESHVHYPNIKPPVQYGPRDAITRNKISQAHKNNNAWHYKRAVQTPLGKFESLKDAATAYNRHPSSIRERIQRHPKEYFFIC